MLMHFHIAAKPCEAAETYFGIKVPNADESRNDEVERLLARNLARAYIKLIRSLDQGDMISVAVQVFVENELDCIFQVEPTSIDLVEFVVTRLQPDGSPLTPTTE